MKRKSVKKVRTASCAKAIQLRKTSFLIALQKSLGVVTAASKATGIARQKHYDWQVQDAEYRKAVEEIGEESIDFAESKLFELIKGAELPEDKFFVIKGRVVTKKTIKRYPPDTASAIFYLKTKGKARGFIERTEVTGKDGKDLIDFDWNKIFTPPEKAEQKKLNVKK